LPNGAVGFETAKGPPQYKRLPLDGESVPECGDVQVAAGELNVAAVYVMGPLNLPLGGLAAEPGIVATNAAMAKQPTSARVIFRLSEADRIRT
jgi:hypothetical protein